MTAVWGGFWMMAIGIVFIILVDYFNVNDDKNIEKMISNQKRAIRKNDDDYKKQLEDELLEIKKLKGG
jgi:F0F1-type ATP synthase membrane subunit b/b'